MSPSKSFHCASIFHSKWIGKSFCWLVHLLQLQLAYRKQPSISTAVLEATAAAAPPALWSATFLGIKDSVGRLRRPPFFLRFVGLSRLLKRHRGRVVSYQSWNVWRRRMTRKGDGNLRLKAAAAPRLGAKDNHGMCKEAENSSKSCGGSNTISELFYRDWLPFRLKKSFCWQDLGRVYRLKFVCHTSK